MIECLPWGMGDNSMSSSEGLGKPAVLCRTSPKRRKFLSTYALSYRGIIEIHLRSVDRSTKILIIGDFDWSKTIAEKLSNFLSNKKGQTWRTLMHLGYFHKHLPKPQVGRSSRLWGSVDLIKGTHDQQWIKSASHYFDVEGRYLPGGAVLYAGHKNSSLFHYSIEPAQKPTGAPSSSLRE